MQSSATTVEQYLSELPADRREAMNWSLITYQVPLEAYPDTYNGKLLMYTALASQKNDMTVYLIGIYIEKRSIESLKKHIVQQVRNMMLENRVYVSKSWTIFLCS